MKTITHLDKPIKIATPLTLISQQEYDSMVETLEILSDKKILSRIESAVQNIRKGKIFSHKQVFRHNPNDKI
ncbi:MAG: hypothetical protein AB1349_06595 [Elusimicrobiota bacterium]